MTKSNDLSSKPKVNNQLIIIGNGYDLALGLPTSYNDFLLNYFKNILSNGLEVIDYRNSYNEDSLFRISAKPNYNKNFENLKSIKNLKEELKNREITVEGLSGFSRQLYNSIDSWVDIEQTFYNELKLIMTDGDLNNGSFDILNKQLDELKMLLIEYLKNTCKGNNQNIIEDRFLFRNFITQYPNDIGRNTSTAHILNFNYTHTANTYKDTKYYGKDITINHIHGILDDPEEFVIFGFGDEKDDAYKELEKLNINEAFKHIKSFGYFQNNRYKELLAFINGEKYDVVILGHSCGLSDRTMLSTIFEHDNCEKIRICHYQKKDSLDREDYKQKTYNISRLFDSKKSLRDKIISFDPEDRIPQHND